ncbi:hypothetical protein EON83_00765 [bacterium]|nr:MAG: hypothetical protein EON83_00765 [bacterium]
MMPTITANTLFIFSYFPDLIGLENKVDKNSQEWKDFVDSVKIRNRITHPKKFADININSHEFEKIRGATQWWFSEHGRIMKSVGEKLISE